MPRLPGSPTGVAAAGLALLLALAGCTGGDDEDPEGARTPGGTTAPGIETSVKVGEVVGRLPKGPAREVAADVTEIVDRWLNAAYVGGDYPRARFGEAFPGFTEDAARLATRQRALMSNAEIAEDVESVTAVRRVVSVDVLAPKGKPAGATAHVNLVMDLAGPKVDRTDQVRGRVLLTKSKRGWRIFGFDIERGEVEG